jgi:hypothetical protein
MSEYDPNDNRRLSDGGPLVNPHEICDSSNHTPSLLQDKVLHRPVETAGEQRKPYARIDLFGF